MFTFNPLISHLPFVSCVLCVSACVREVFCQVLTHGIESVFLVGWQPQEFIGLHHPNLRYFGQFE